MHYMHCMHNVVFGKSLNIVEWVSYHRGGLVACWGLSCRGSCPRRGHGCTENQVGVIMYLPERPVG